MSRIEHHSAQAPFSGYPGDLDSVARLMIPIIFAGGNSLRTGVSLPGTDLEIRMKAHHEIYVLVVWKQKKMVYAHVFCILGFQHHRAMCIVMMLYAKYLGMRPRLPKEKNWIHSIPLEPSVLSDAEVVMSLQIAYFTYNAILQMVNEEEYEPELVTI